MSLAGLRGRITTLTFNVAFNHWDSLGPRQEFKSACVCVCVSLQESYRIISIVSLIINLNFPVCLDLVSMVESQL